MRTLDAVDIGIDLGTTFSVLAVKGRWEESPSDYPKGLYLDECDVTILRSPTGEATFPSVLWSDPHTGKPFVGAAAKQKAAEGQSPIMFSKRSIGTDEPLWLNGRSWTARQVATEILKYLKACAERALGRRVRRAVVTHPAYFSPNQRQETKEAAEAAGFEMSSNSQLLMEPTAAALAYMLKTERDPLQILTYDLGGGTFDVTVLERRDGVISMTAFDGDRLLGGYNFDRELVQWIVRRLRDQGRAIAYDDANAEHRGRRARILTVAETIKLALSRQKDPDAPVEISEEGLLSDAQGNDVPFRERITRREFSTLIAPLIERTIEGCTRALRTAQLKPQDIDAIVLVGGSTYGPWIREALRDTFGVTMEPYYPDLCVAAGAVLHLDQLSRQVDTTELTLHVEAPATSALPECTVSGAILATAGTPPLSADRLAQLQIVLNASHSGPIEPISPNAAGKFLFADIELDMTQPTQMQLQIADRAGQTQLVYDFQVAYDPNAQERVIYNVLPKAIFVRVADGLNLLADKGVSLPTELYTIDLERIFDDETVEIPIIQEHDEIGRIVIGGLPNSAGAGSTVRLEVRITDENALIGRVVVQDKQGRVAVESDVDISFPPIAIPSRAALRERFAELEDRRVELSAVSDDAEHRAMLGGLGRKLSLRLQHLFDEMEPDKQEIHQALCEFENVVDPPREEMSPSRAHFERYVDACMAFIRSSDDPEVNSYTGTVNDIADKGKMAYAEKNARAWSLHNQNIIATYRKLEKLVRAPNGGGGSDDVTADMLKNHFQESIVDRLRADLDTAREKHRGEPDYLRRIGPRLDEADVLLKKMESEIAAVPDDIEASRAHAMLTKATRPKSRAEALIKHCADDLKAVE